MKDASARKSRRVAKTAIRSTIDRGARRYERGGLSRLIPIDPDSIAPGSTATQKVVDQLASALRGERARAGHWTYDIARHVALAQALMAERKRLARELVAERNTKAKKEGRPKAAPQY